MPSKEIAYEFILEELDGASQGNDASQNFARSSGIPASAYRRALRNSKPDVDGPDGPQQLLLGLSMQLMPNQALMAEFRCKVDDKIMKRYALGKYSTTSSAGAHLSITSLTAPGLPPVSDDGLANTTRERYDLANITTKDIAVIVKGTEPKEVGLLLRRAATAGSNDAAVFLAASLDRLIQNSGGENAPKHLHDELFFFTELAAQRGDIDSQFNLAKHYLCQSMMTDGNIDEAGYDNMKKAQYWYETSAKGGSEESLQALAEMRDFFSWAHTAFGKEK